MKQHENWSFETGIIENICHKNNLKKPPKVKEKADYMISKYSTSKKKKKKSGSCTYQKKKILLRITLFFFSCSVKTLMGVTLGIIFYILNKHMHF